MPTVVFTVDEVSMGVRKWYLGLGVKRTVVVVEHIGIAITDHSLSAWGIGLSVRAVDKFAAAFDEIFTGLVCEWPTGTLRASNADGISEVR